MRRAIHLLIIVTVFWCGLHLSSAEADIGVSTAFESSVSAQLHGHDADDERQGNFLHGCHSHCPVATDITSGPMLSAPDPVRALFFVMPSLRLASVDTAPPIEPPSA